MEKWYIVHTRTRWEKKVTDALGQKGIESYCPVKKVKRKWSDRIKTIEEPIFRSYIFVKISPEQRTDVRISDGVVNFVHRNGKPLQIREKEMKALRKLMVTASTSTSLEITDKDPGTGRANKEALTFLAYMERFSNSFLTMQSASNYVSV